MLIQEQLFFITVLYFFSSPFLKGKFQHGYSHSQVQMCFGVMNHTSWFGRSQENTLEYIVPKVLCRKDTGVCCFELGSSVPVKDLLTFWHFSQFCTSNFLATVWGRPIAGPAGLCPCAQSELHKDNVRWIWCGGTWLACSSDLNTTGRDESTNCEPGLLSQHVPSLMIESAQIPTDTLQNLVESLPRRPVIAGKWGPNCFHGFIVGCPTSSYMCDGPVSTDFWPYTVLLCFECWLEKVMECKCTLIITQMLYFRRLSKCQGLNLEILSQSPRQDRIQICAHNKL